MGQYVPAKPAPLPRLVFAVDATASRKGAWEAARQTTDALFTAIPGKLEVALTVHGGAKMHTFTEFETELGYLREFMAAVECRAGETCIADMLMRTLASANVKVFLYIGDHIEDEPTDLIELAEQCGRRALRIIVLHDTSQHPSETNRAKPIFEAMARLSGGVVLNFDHTAVAEIREMLSAIAVLAGQGRDGLVAKRTRLKGADNLLRLLPP